MPTAMDEERLRVMAAGCLAVADNIPKLRQHGQPLLIPPLLSLGLSMEEKSGRLQFQHVPESALHWLSHRSPLLADLKLSGSPKPVAFAFDSFPVEGQGTLFSFTFDSMLRQALAVKKKAKKKQTCATWHDEPAHNMPAILEMLALLAYCAAESDAEFFLSCACFHTGLQIVNSESEKGKAELDLRRALTLMPPSPALQDALRPKVEACLSEAESCLSSVYCFCSSCTVKHFAATAASMLESYGPGMIRETLLHLCQGSSLEERVTQCQLALKGMCGSKKTWLSVSNQMEVKINIKNLLKQAVVPREHSNGKPVLVTPARLEQAYVDVVRILAADHEKRGSASLCSQLNLLPKLKAEVNRLFHLGPQKIMSDGQEDALEGLPAIQANLAPQQAVPDGPQSTAGDLVTVRWSVAQRNIPALACVAAPESAIVDQNVLNPNEVAEGLACGNLTLEVDEKGSLKLRRMAKPSAPTAKGFPPKGSPAKPKATNIESLPNTRSKQLNQSASYFLPPISSMAFTGQNPQVPQGAAVENAEPPSAPPMYTPPIHVGPLPAPPVHGAPIQGAPLPAALIQAAAIRTAPKGAYPRAGPSAAYNSWPVNTPLEISFEGTEPVVTEMPKAPEEDDELQPIDNEEGDASRVDDSDGSELSLLQVLPLEVQEAIEKCIAERTSAADSSLSLTARKKHRVLVEVVLDLGRNVVLLFLDGSQVRLDLIANVSAAMRSIALGVKRIEGENVEVEDTPQATQALIKSWLTVDNRMGIPGTLHRISALQDRTEHINGLTCRIGRHVTGRANLLLDVIGKVAPKKMSNGTPGLTGASLLLLGPPGVGKTTLLRDIIYMLANKFELGVKVMVVDTSNELGGDSSVPHPALGHARRVSVRDRSKQHKELLEAVQNHTPSVVVVDEISTAKEADAIKAVGHRGAVMVATAHGNSINDLIKNPELVNLIGGLSEVTMGDIRAEKTNAGKKTKIERSGPPTFSIIVEVLGFDTLRVHLDCAASIDATLRGRTACAQKRWLKGDKMAVSFEGSPPPSFAKSSRKRGAADPLSTGLPKIVKRAR